MESTLGERWDALRARILDDEDKILFDEARRCSDAGAQRSSYIMVWLAVAASLRNKLTTMATRSEQIGKAVKELKRKEPDRNAIDPTLLEYACDFGLIDDFESKKLEQIRSLRNEYAHPRKVHPSHEEVLGAAAVECALEKPARLGDGWANHLIDGLFTDPTYLDDIEGAVEKLPTARSTSCSRMSALACSKRS